jgi:hypothetical protein
MFLFEVYALRSRELMSLGISELHASAILEARQLSLQGWWPPEEVGLKREGGTMGFKK